MASFDYTITTDAFSLDGHSFGAQTLDFTLPYSVNGTFPLSGVTFAGVTMDTASVHPVTLNEVYLTVQGMGASLQSPFLMLPTMSSQTTMGFNDSFVAVVPGGDGFITGKITATGISLPEPGILPLLVPALIWLAWSLCLRHKTPRTSWQAPSDCAQPATDRC